MKAKVEVELDLGGLERVPQAIFALFGRIAEYLRVRYYLWRYAYKPGGAVDRVTGHQTQDHIDATARHVAPKREYDGWE